jgi:lysophospholipase L1-like esterase
MCLRPTAAGPLEECAARSLKAGEKTASMRILHFGDSHSALPAVQQDYRGLFQGRFGDGGPGFGLPWVNPQPDLRARASRGWHKPPQHAQRAAGGLQAAWIEAVRAGETATLEGDFSRLRIHFQSLPGGGSAKILVDGRLLEEISLRGTMPELKVFERSLPPSRRLDVVTSRPGPVRLLGVSLEGPAGATYSVLAANGVQASWLLAIPEELFAAQVQAEAPDLVILAFGTNEANDRLFDPEVYRGNLEALLARFRKAAPSAGLVLFGPPDAKLPRSQPGALDRVIQVQRAVAAAHGARFWDQREAMGGPGAMAAWSQAGLARPDGVHLTKEGYRRLAQAFRERFFEASPGTFQVARRTAPEEGGHPIYVFKTRDGRTLITDDPAAVAGEQGEWEGRRPE